MERLDQNVLIAMNYNIPDQTAKCYVGPVDAKALVWNQHAQGGKGKHQHTIDYHANMAIKTLNGEFSERLRSGRHWKLLEELPDIDAENPFNSFFDTSDIVRKQCYKSVKGETEKLIKYFKDIQTANRGELAETWSEWTKFELQGETAESFKKAVFPNLLHPQFALTERQYKAMKKVYDDWGATPAQILHALQLLPNENMLNRAFHMNNVVQIHPNDISYSASGELRRVRCIWKKSACVVDVITLFLKCGHQFTAWDLYWYYWNAEKYSRKRGRGQRSKESQEGAWYRFEKQGNFSKGRTAVGEAWRA